MKIIIAASVCLAGAGVVLADTIDLTYLDKGAGKGNLEYDLGSGYTHVFAGQLRHMFANGTGAAASISGNFLTYCTDLTQGVPMVTNTFDVVNVSATPDPGPMGATKAQAIYDMFDYATNNIMDPFSPVAPDEFAAAVQIAVWEVVHDFGGTLDVTAGNFKIRRENGNPLTPTTQTYLGQLFGAIGSNAPKNGLTGLTNHDDQDQLFIIPAPGSLALLGLASLVAFNRRR